MPSTTAASITARLTSVPAHDCDHDPLPPRWLHARIPKAELFWVVCGGRFWGLVDREFVQSGVLTQAVVGQLEQLPLLKMGIKANDCGIVKWRETVGLQRRANLMNAWDPDILLCQTRARLDFPPSWCIN